MMRQRRRRRALRDLEAKRIGPADQLASAQREALAAREASAAASAKVEECVSLLADPLRVEQTAQLHRYMRIAVRTIADAVNGKPVHPDDYAGAVAVIEDCAADTGAYIRVRADERAEVMKELRKAGFR